MRKIVVTMWTTLDGFVAGPRDEMDWALLDEQVETYERDLVESAGALLLGRGTHTDFAGHWPQVAHDPDQTQELRGYARCVDSKDGRRSSQRRDGGAPVTSGDESGVGSSPERVGPERRSRS